jgi:hypothetical protein
MFWNKLKNARIFLLFLFLFVYSSTIFGQQLDTIFIDLNSLSKQDTLWSIDYNIPKSKCKRGTLNIPIQLESHDTSAVYLINGFKGNGYVSRKNLEPVLIDAKDSVFYENWILHENVLSADCSKNRKILTFSVKYYNGFYYNKGESMFHDKRLKVRYLYTD